MMHNVQVNSFSTILLLYFGVFFHFDTCSQVSSLQETNSKLNKETEEKEKQLQLMKMREESLTKLVRD